MFFVVFFAVCGKKTESLAASGEKKNGESFSDSVAHCGFRFPERSLAGCPSAPPHHPLGPPRPLLPRKTIKSQKTLLLLLLHSHTNTMSPLPANDSIMMHITDVED